MKELNWWTNLTLGILIKHWVLFDVTIISLLYIVILFSTHLSYFFHLVDFLSNLVYNWVFKLFIRKYHQRLSTTTNMLQKKTPSRRIERKLGAQSRSSIELDNYRELCLTTMPDTKYSSEMWLHNVVYIWAILQENMIKWRSILLKQC